MNADLEFDERPQGFGIVFAHKPPHYDMQVRKGDRVVLRTKGVDVHVQITSANGTSLNGRCMVNGTPVSFTERHVFRCVRMSS